MRKFLLILICLMGIPTLAQEKMRIVMNDGTPMDFYIDNIQDMSFYTPAPLDIVGEWVTVSDVYGGLMECYTFNDDGTMMYKVAYMDYQMYYEYDGVYSLEGNVVKITMLGSTFPLEIVSYTDDEFLSTANATFYRVQEGVYNITVESEPIIIGNSDDIIVYVDNYFISMENNKIVPLRDGCGYALVQNVETQEVEAYEVNVEFVAPSVIDWTKYLKRAKEEIISEFGEPDQTNDEKHTISYTQQGFDSAISYLIFCFDENSDKVLSVHVGFYDEEKRQNYCDYIEENYVFGEATGSGKIYYDTESPDSASVKFTVYDASVMCVIVYTDLKATPISAVDWTQYFKKSGEEIKAEFGSNPDITDDDEYEDYSMVYYSINGLKYISFTFDKGFENVTSIMVSFNDASAMQGYCDAIAEKYILDVDNSSETSKVYYDTDSKSTASVRIRINTSKNYISYSDLSE